MLGTGTETGEVEKQRRQNNKKKKHADIALFFFLKYVQYEKWENENIS